MISAELQNIIALIIVTTAFGWLLWQWLHQRKSGCGCDLCERAPHPQRDPAGKNTSLIPEDEIR